MADHGDEPEATSPTVDEVVTAVRSLVEVMARGGISELDLNVGELSLRLRSQNASSVSTPAHAPEPVTPSQGAFLDDAPAPDGHIISSPMVGTYYSSPSPGAPEFITIGDTISVGQVVGIVEAMKIMNEITADKGGVVTEIMVTNGQAVEYGSPIVRLQA